MFHLMRRIWLIVVLILLLLVMVGCDQGKVKSLLTIGNEDIYEDEVMLYLLQTYNEFEQHGGEEVWSIKDFSGGKSASNVAKQGALDNLIMKKVLVSKANELDISLDDEQSEQVDTMAQQYYDDLPSSFVEDYSITLEVVRRVFKESQIANLVENRTKESYQVTDVGIDNKLVENEEYNWLSQQMANGVKSLLTLYSIERVRIYTHEKNEADEYILKSEEALKVVWEKIENAYEELMNGSEFLEVAKAYSDVDIDETDLVMENVSKLQISDKVSEVMDDMDIGDISGIIEGDRALYIIHLVNEIEPTEDEIQAFNDSFKSWKIALEEEARETIVSEGFQSLYEQWQQDVTIELSERWKALDILAVGDYVH